MTTYQDRWGRFHDKPCIDGNPSSNNGWIYTAYAKKLGFELSASGLQICYNACMLHPTLPQFNRSPGKAEPPASRDEVLGLTYLGMLEYHKEGSWNFCPYPIPPFNPLKTITAAYRLKGAHRNALWQNGGEPHMFRFAFSVPLQDRAFCMRQTGKSNIFYSIVEWVAKKRKSDNISSRLIEWLKWGDAPDLELFEEYFGENHVFCQKIRNDLTNPASSV